jgi:gliding motility-associated-like protein
MNRPPRVLTFTNQSTVPTGITTPNFRWTYQLVSPTSGVETEFARGTTLTNKPELTLTQSGMYIIRLYASNNAASGTRCTETVATYRVNVPTIEIPNVFTPNRDGLNDTFIVQAEQVGNKVEIFNRWGRKVKEFSNYNNDWDGENQPSGMYYYVITNNVGKATKGWVELIR